MKVSFDKQQLLAALISAASISQAKNTISSIEGLLFECPPGEKFGEYDGEKDNVCRISAFDLEKGLRMTLPCTIFEKGTYIINTNKILNIVRVLPDGEIVIEIDEKNKVTVTGGDSGFEITAASGAEFPAMPMLTGDKMFTLPQYLLREKIEETVFAVAVNDPRPAFNGALFRIRGGELTVVGCDTQRLAVSCCALENVDIPDTDVIIPGKFLGELSKMLKDSEEEVTMIIGRKHIIFKIDSVWFFTRVIEAEYMDYEKVLPKSYMTQVYVNRGDLISAVDRAAVITEGKLGGNTKPPVKVDLKNGAIELFSISEGGSIHETVPCAMDGVDLTIGFTCRLLLDSLKSCPNTCDTLRIRFNKATMGIVIESAQGSDLIQSTPDPEIFGNRELDTNGKGDTEDAPRFLYFVMPRHL